MAGERAGVAVRVLGAFEVTVGGRAVPPGGPLQRAVLARVLVGGRGAASADQIATDVWGERATRSTAASVHAYVSRLRRLLGEQAVGRRSGGYVLDRAVVSVDAEPFVDEVGRGRAALDRGEDGAAATLLRAALDRWQGARAFDGLGDLPFLVAEAARLEELRMVAAEALADARLRQGRGGDVVEVLQELALQDPLRESLAVRLVRLLGAAGRPADALVAFDRCRSALADHLGVDPGGALRQVHAAVLGGASGTGAVPVAEPVLPINLPPRNRSFVGRAALLDQVGRALDDDEHRPRAVALCGLAGVGKTETAIELTHRRRRPGRVAWWIAAADPAGTAAGLADLAAALGLGGRQREDDTWTALWDELDRTPGWILAFDNADEPELIKPLLPTARRGDVVITSRNPAWRQLARPVAVPALTRAEAVTYVEQRTGDDDAAGADALAELLGDLPLALDQACAYVEQTGMSVGDYVGMFRRHRAGLLLRGDAGGRTVATTWGLAFDRLRVRSPRAAAVLETIAFLSADAVPVEMLGPLAPDELDLQDALAELLRLSLVDRKAGVLRVHRLVQDVARARLSGPAARERLEQATAICIRHRDGDESTVAAHLGALAAHADALGVVPDGLVGALGAAAAGHTARALYPAAEQVLRQALRLLDVDGAADPAQLGALLCQLGEVLDAAGRLTEALEAHRRAVHVLDAVVEPDEVLLAHAHNRLGHALNCADRIDDALLAHERAITILRAAARPDLLAAVLVDLGFTLWAAHRLDRAGAALRAGRDLLERQARRESREWAHATEGLGMVAQDAGDLATAVEHQRTAIAVFTRVCGADHPDTAQALDKLGYALRLRGEALDAVEAHQGAVRLLERTLGADDTRVAMALTNLGLALAEAGRAQEADDAQARAHAIFCDVLGPMHSSTLLAARRRAVAMSTNGQHRAARALLGEILEVVVSRAGDNDAELARIAADTALVYGVDDVAAQRVMT